MNIPSSSSGRRLHESVNWTSSDPPRLPKHWAYLLPLTMTHEVELWGNSLLILLVKELVTRDSAMTGAGAADVVALSDQVIVSEYLISIVQELGGMKNRPDKAAARTWVRNFFAFVFEEYGFGGARAWAGHLFEARIKEICKYRKFKEEKLVELCASPSMQMQQTDSIFALPASYPAITPFKEQVSSPLLIAAIHDKSYHPQLPPLTNSSWNDVYARKLKTSYSSALENLGDAILRWILAQVARKTIPTLTAEGTLSLSSVINSNVIYGNIAQRLRLHKNARVSTDIRLPTPGNVVLNPIKQYANLFETMVAAYWVQAGVTYEEVFNWVDVTFRPLFYAAEQDIRNAIKAKQNERARLKTESREAKLTTCIIGEVGGLRPIEGLPPGPVTRSNAARAKAQLYALEETGAIKPPSSPPAKRTRYERTGPVLNLPQEVVDLTMLELD